MKAVRIVAVSVHEIIRGYISVIIMHQQRHVLQFLTLSSVFLYIFNWIYL